MCALLTEIIPKQNFEIVRDQIGLIIKDELENQLSLNQDESKILDVNVFVERHVDIDHTETPLINVLFDTGIINSQDNESQNGVHTYNLDFFVGAKSNQVEKGDKIALVDLQRLMGIVNSIIMSPHYLTLNIPRPSIENRTIRSLAIGGPTDNKDSSKVMHGRIVLDVRFGETTEQFKPRQIEGSDTVVKLEETDKGYQYILNSV